MKKNIAEDNIVKCIRDHFRLKENSIKDEALRDIRFFSEPDNEDYYEPVTICNAFNNIYENNGHNGKTLSIQEYLHKNRPNLSKNINNMKTQGECKN